jgi:hypothetical protein
VYGELAERIRGEVPDLERVVQRAQQAWLQVQGIPDERPSWIPLPSTSTLSTREWSGCSSWSPDTWIVPSLLGGHGIVICFSR